MKYWQINEDASNISCFRNYSRKRDLVHSEKWSWLLLTDLKVFCQWDNRNISLFRTIDSKSLNLYFLCQPSFPQTGGVYRICTKQAVENDLSVAWLDKRLPWIEDKPTSFLRVKGDHHTLRNKDALSGVHTNFLSNKRAQRFPSVAVQDNIG